MAKVQLDILTNAPQVLDQIAGANQEVAQAAKQAGDAQKKAFTDSDQAAKKEVKTIQSLKKEIRDLQSAALAAGEGTAEFARNIALAGQRKADLRDLQQAVDALDPDRVAQGFLSLARVGAGAFTVLESGAALAGVRNEDLTRTILKVQAAQGVLAGLQELANSRDVIARLKIIALQKLQTLETQRGIVAIQGATVASRLLALALTPTGIFAIIAALGALVTTVVLYRKETERATEAEKERSRAIDGTIILNNDLRKTYNDQLIKLNELNNEYLVFHGVLTETEAAIDNVNTRLRANQQEITQTAQQQVSETKSFFNTVINLVKAGGNSIIAEGIRQQEEREILAKQDQDNIEAAFNAGLEISRLRLEQQKKDQAAAKQAAELAKRMRDEEKRQEIDKFEKLKQSTKLFVEDSIEAEQFLANETIKENDKKIQDLINRNGDRVILEDEANKELLELLQKYYDDKKKLDDDAEQEEEERRNERLKAFNIYANSLIASIGSISEINSIQVDNEIKQIESVKNAEISAINERIEAANRAGANTEELERKKQQLEQQAAQKTEALRKKEFERAKKFQKAQAIISGALAVTNAYATVPFIPAGLAAAIAAGIEVAFQLAKIDQATFREGGYTGDGSPDQPAGTVHKREFVSTAETTEKHRPLLEALHNDDYSGLTPMDLDPILRGTGVILQQDAIGKINKDGAIVREMENQRRSASEMEMRSLNRNFRKFINIYKAQPTEKIGPDGTKVIKTGNTTRIIRKRNG